MKHAADTYLWIVEKGLLFAHISFFKKFFLLEIKRLFVLPSQDQYFKGRNIHAFMKEAAIQRCSQEKLFCEYAANLQENTHAEVRFQLSCKLTLLNSHFPQFLPVFPQNFWTSKLGEIKLFFAVFLDFASFDSLPITTFSLLLFFVFLENYKPIET